MRRRLAREGIMIVVLAPNGESEIQALGLPLDEDMDEFIAECRSDVAEAVRKKKGKDARDFAAITEAARIAARRAAQRWSGKRPQVRVILPGLNS